MPMQKILGVGEVMIEIGSSASDPGCLRRRYGGDTLNTCVYLARLLPPQAFQVSYVTRLGDDRLSDWMIREIAAEGVDCGAIARAANQRPGLYLIETDASGERSFSFWRDSAPVRRLFDGETEPGIEALEGADVLYVSGISLAVLGAEGRAALLGAMAAARAAGATVAFDSNHRAALWETAQAARAWTRRAAAEATLFLPSLEDLEALFDCPSAERATDICRAFTAATTVVTTGGGPILLDEGGRRDSVALERLAQCLDTTGAGDAFNAGFIAARVTGRPLADCCRIGHAVAGRVVMAQGAIAPRAATQAAAELLASAEPTGSEGIQ